MTESGKSFWQTVPGLLTAAAALVTALGGVLGILVQNGIIGRASEEPTAAVAETPVARDSDRAPAVKNTSPTAQPTDTSTLIPWANATATLVRKDGTSATVKAPTVGLTCSTENLQFKNGQRLSLERVRSIQFDTIYLENASADGSVTLLDGRELKDPIYTWNCPIMGTTELGPLQIELKDIKRIDFHR
jgi:hypothetical protein